MLGVLHRARALARQHVVTRRLLLREGECGLGLIELRPRGVDLRLLHGDPGVDIGDAGLGHRDFRIRLGERDPVIAVVDAGDDLAFRDMLVVGDEHLGDIARNLRGDADRTRGDEGVVGGFEMAGVVPP